MVEAPPTRSASVVDVNGPVPGAEGPSSSPSCPGCGKAVDALRAGHVAIYDGLFLYYCDATCKALHLRAIASHIGDDIPTLDPPAVAERLVAVMAKSAKANGTNGHGRHQGEDEPRPARANAEPPCTPVEAPSTLTTPTFVPEDLAPRKPTEVTCEPPRAEPPPPEPAAISAPAAASLEAAAEAPTSIAPRTLRSPLPAPLPPAQVREGGAPAISPVERARQVVSLVGVVAGILVPLLVIADVGLGARLGLAALAAAALVARLLLTPRDPADASVLVVALPVAGAVACGVAGHLAGDPRAAAIAVLGGLSASVAIAVEEAVTRARAEVNARRASIGRALDVASRVLRGDGPSAMQRDVKAGELVLVEAGDVVGVDGVASAGEAIVVPWHEATTEMLKGEGDAVVAGARIVSGRLRIVTAWAGGERAWARATSSSVVRPDVSAPMARLARAILERGAPAVAIVAALAAVASGGATGWLDAVATACAVCLSLGGRGLVAAVALVHARAQMRALEHGIVYKDARTFDAAGRAAIAVACSRGTVLTGEPEIVALERVGSPDSAASETRILALASGAETASTHPFANAILRAARTRGVRPENVRSATVHAGLGVTALASSGDRLVVGSRALLLQEKVSVAVAEARASELEAQGRSVLLVALAGKLVGLVALQDGLRAGARAAVQRLLDARIEPVLLSGESRETCETIARALEIDHVRPEVLPTDRGAEVRALAEGGHVVAVIGHPSSDDGALGAADVAVAMGAPRAPGEWGVWLASDDVRDAALALSVPHAARDRARVALAIGLTPGAIALLSLAFGVGPLVCGPIALAAAAGASLAVALRD